MERVFTDPRGGEQAPLQSWISDGLERQRPQLFLWLPVGLGIGIGLYFGAAVEPVFPIGVWALAFIGLALGIRATSIAVLQLSLIHI